MREILFRAKAINREKGYHRTKYKNGEWVYGLITKLYDERFENLPAEMTDINGISGIEVDFNTVGQFTGLTDRSGNKIFEGDIVRSREFGDVHLVWYFGDNRHPAFDCVPNAHVEGNGLSYYANVGGLDIIGNIHDNEEQLKSKEGAKE